jgi:hypothetical protein
MRLSIPASSITILNIYRPPSLSIPDFISDFSTLLEDFISQPSELLITGDFTFHLNSSCQSSSDTLFTTLLDTFSLNQHITFPTPISLHTVDLLITRSASTLVTSTTFADPGLSDHFAILCSLSVPTNSRPARVTKMVRSFRSINTTAFSNDIIDIQYMFHT